MAARQATLVPLLLLALLGDRTAAPQSVIPQDPIQICTWPTPEAALMSCDSGSVIVILNTYITRLAGQVANCLNSHATGRREYAQCQLAAPADFVTFLASSCNYTSRCTLSQFSWPTVVVGVTMCGNKSDAALERNFMVVNWGCVGYVPPETNLDSNDTSSTDASEDVITYDNRAWIIPVGVCVGLIVLGGVLTGLLIWRRDLLKQKARELRRRRREQRRQAKLQLAAASGLPQLPQSDADGSKVAVAGWVDGASGNDPLATVAGAVQYQSISEIDGHALSSPPAYSVATLDSKLPERQLDLSGRGRREGCHSSTTSTLTGSSTATRARSSSSGGRTHHRSGQKKGAGKHRSKRDYSSQSEMSDADIERRRRRREQLYKGATRIRKPDELSLSSPSDRSQSEPSGTEAPKADAVAVDPATSG